MVGEGAGMSETTDIVTETAEGPERLAPEQVRQLFLFESLSDEQLDWLSRQGRVEDRRPGEMVFTEGDEATCFFVLLEGTVVLRRRVEGDDVEITRTEQRGVYAGATQAYLHTSEPQTYSNSLQALTESRFFVIPADEFATMVRQWFPMAMHLLEGLFIGLRTSHAIVGQRERLLGLGRLTAGLTHELNNPAAAAVRATSSLRERVSMMRHKLASLADGRLSGADLLRLASVQDEAVERLGKAPKLGPMEASDAEDEIADWLDAHHLQAGWELAPTLVAAGADPAWLDTVTETIPQEYLEGGLRWVAYTLETELLMNEIEDATHRISALVGAAKQYSQLDRAAHQEIDVRDGLDSTLVMLGGKLKGRGITVVKEYAAGLPDIPAYPAELNQVWTNLIDNAIGAMGSAGTLTLRTSLDGDHVLVEVCDTGPGVPPENLKRIFEPFFTTKPVGEGTGLGLDISYRIVVQRHRGDLRVKSQPGDTRFQVRLPVDEPAADPT
jgi:signal transduction histidine kinase